MELPDQPERPDPTGRALSLSVSQSGRVYLEHAGAADAACLPAPVAQRIEAAFLRGSAQGLLHLGACELTTDLPLGFAYFRNIGRRFMCMLCSIPGIGGAQRSGRIRVPLPVAVLDELATSVPPLSGAEHLGRQAITELWTDLLGALQDELAAFSGPFAQYLESKHPLWLRVGRICFHLLERPDHPGIPFALQATYTTQVSCQGKVHHVPLAEALDQLAAERGAAARLLLPVRQALKKSEFLRELEGLRPAAPPAADEARWIAERHDLSPDQAHRFLLDVPLYEECGVMVRVPDWWHKRRRPQVRVTLGERPPADLDTAALLDFHMSLVLDGEPIAEEEWELLLKGTAGLSLIKGKWVEIDRALLAEVLAHWQKVQRAAFAHGLSFSEGMRLIARAVEQPSEAPGIPESQVRAGAWLAGVMEGLRHPETLAAADPGPDLKAALRPYQQVGVRWLWLLHCLGLGACLADDMGLGKTVQVLALLLLRQQRASPGLSLLVVPASLLGNWRAELSRFAPGLRLLCVHPSALQRERLAALGPDDLVDLDVVLTSYGSLQRWKWLGEVPWGLVVLDEAQVIRNPAARHTRAVKALRSRARLALSGTPVTNRLADLWSLFDFLNPGLLGTAKKFGQFERRLSQGRAYGPLRRLIRPYILRRLKSDRRIIADLPDKTEMLAPCSLSRKQVALYQQAVADLGQHLQGLGGIRRRGVILSYLLRLKQICNHPSQWLGDGAYAPIESGKFARLAELGAAIAREKQKVLVFTQFRELTGPLSAFLSGVFGQAGLVLHGETEIRRRAVLCAEFQKQHGPPFFVLSLKAGGVGLNLSAATHVIHFDRWWNPAEENQATDRAYRIGQKYPVLVHKFVCSGTIEERIDALIAAKEGLQDQVLDSGGDALLTEMSDEELIALVSLDIHSAMA